jgi:hypothetical protein
MPIKIDENKDYFELTGLVRGNNPEYLGVTKYTVESCPKIGDKKPHFVGHQSQGGNTHLRGIGESKIEVMNFLYDTLVLDVKKLLRRSPGTQIVENLRGKRISQLVKKI